MTRQKQILIVTVLVALVIVSCGTGPWIVRKNLYETFREPVHGRLESSLPRTDGYYIQTAVVNPMNSYYDALIFQQDGYVTDFRILISDYENEIRSVITERTDTVYRDLDWWKMVQGIILIEHYAENKMQMSTWNYFQRGIIVNDTLIELKHDDSSFQPINYKFVKTDSLPIIVNKARYLSKSWYTSGIHEQRKQISLNSW